MISPLRLMSWAPFTEAIMASSSESYDGSTHEEVKNLSERQEADEEHADKTDAVSNHARLVGRMRRVYYFLHSTYDELDKDRSGAISAVEMTEMLQKALSQEGLSRIASKHHEDHRFRASNHQRNIRYRCSWLDRH
jgi:hypothetical protein